MVTTTVCNMARYSSPILRCAPRSPERRLLRGMLLRTALDLAAFRPGTRLHEEAAWWVRRHSTEPCGFDWVCCGLGLDPLATATILLNPDRRSGEALRQVAKQHTSW